jgi:hypothetical protein
VPPHDLTEGVGVTFHMAGEEFGIRSVIFDHPPPPLACCSARTYATGSAGIAAVTVNVGVFEGDELLTYCEIM